MHVSVQAVLWSALYGINPLQFHARGLRIEMMGDDTWVDLFPENFHRKLPLPSFNVKVRRYSLGVTLRACNVIMNMRRTRAFR